jgi:hypothetical protein
VVELAKIGIHDATNDTGVNSALAADLLLPQVDEQHLQIYITANIHTMPLTSERAREKRADRRSNVCVFVSDAIHVQLHAANMVL